jgi:hypothetical protein
MEPRDHLSELGEVLYREDMQSSPPDILITNFSMLEYILLRNDDKKLFSRPDLFRLLVLDEVHTYRGTQGMEVACLLRRFHDLLQRKSGAREIDYVRVGLSATLPGDVESQKAVAKFATDLFGADFSPNAVIVERPMDRAGPRPEPLVPRLQAGAELSRLWEVAPVLCKAFAVSCPDNVDEDEEIPLEQWQRLAGALESTFVPSPENLAAERAEILGHILEKSPATRALREITCTDRVVSVDLIAKRLFGEPGGATDPGYALGVFLQLMCGGRLQDQALLSLRAHFFAKEHKEAQICINPDHPTSDVEDTDGWWRALFLVHRSVCDGCGARVYPLNLCRRCGFALLEGWLRKGRYSTERDGLMGEKEFTRVLFRPLKAIPDYLHEKFRTEDPPKGTQVQEYRLCVQCGLRISAGTHGDSVAASHPCGQTQIVEVLEWSSPGAGVRILQCPHCDQEWYRDQEVFTPPAVSPYGAATVILEEIKRAVDAPLEQSINKVLCFSDSRQQAAKVARRLGRTNEDFVFRQLIFRAIRSSEGQCLNTPDLAQSIVGTLRMNTGLAEVFCERGESARDRDLLTRRVATRLFRELCTEYQTLERLGIIDVRYPASLVERGSELVGSHWLGSRLTPAERSALFHVSLDWIFRLNRWAVSPCNLDVEYEKLEYYFDKAVALRGDGTALGFRMAIAHRLSRRLDFYLRVCRKFPVLQGITDLRGFNGLAEDLWKCAVCDSQFLTPRGARGGPDPEKPFVVLEGTEPENFRLKANFETFQWRLRGEEEELWRCDNCQYLTRFNIASVCPVRRCAGELRPTSVHGVLLEQFSPVRHYIELVTRRTPKPLWVEEHTAQISPTRRIEIEEEFRKEDAGSLDVISGSTTFELGVDLGSVNSIFLANLPPQVSNYRQRAGRAGRRPGMLPFVISYVRERPHDKYFWSSVESFIGGPLRVPWLAQPSREIILRHSNAVVFARLLELYPQASRLEGPPCEQFASFCLNGAQRSTIMRESVAPASELARSLRSLLHINPVLSLTPQDCATHYFETVDFASSKYFAGRFDEGSIDVFSDYGILPSYSFPIYVDELALYQKPRREPPRSNLKLQRDRKIALREYFPKNVIEADKWVVQSVGLRNGYAEAQFGICTACRHVSRVVLDSPCGVSGCNGRYRAFRAVIPKAGFLGQVPHKPPPLDSSLFDAVAPEIFYDPASDPPPTLMARGRFLAAARQSAAEMSEARMRMFSPRLTREGIGLVESEERDVADPRHVPSRCLMVPEKTAAPGRREIRAYYLMHEFTTDILRLRFAPEAEGLFLASAPFQESLRSNDGEERKKARTIFLYTLGQALASGAAYQLEIDPAELDFTLRPVSKGAAFDTELILFDTAPGGAGYASKCFEEAELRGVLGKALGVLSCSRCQDSCYNCLRSYSNQWMHARLNRQFVRDGLDRFIKENW